MQILNDKGQECFSYIPDNDCLKEQEVYLARNEFVDLLRKYHKNSEAVHFLADMLEDQVAQIIKLSYMTYEHHLNTLGRMQHEDFCVSPHLLGYLPDC